MTDQQAVQPRHAADGGPLTAMEAIQEAIGSIRFGVVQIIVQDGRVIQIDKTEKIRLA